MTRQTPSTLPSQPLSPETSHPRHPLYPTPSGINVSLHPTSIPWYDWPSIQTMLVESNLIRQHLRAIQENIQLDRERREQIERFRPERERREREANCQPFDLLPEEEMREWRAQGLGLSSSSGLGSGFWMACERERIAVEQVAFRRTPGAPRRRGQDEQRSRSAVHLGVGSFINGHFVPGPSGSDSDTMLWDAPAADDSPSSSSSSLAASDSGNEADDEAEDEAAADVDAGAWDACELCGVTGRFNIQTRHGRIACVRCAMRGSGLPRRR
ncbi:hypothetical protein LTR78_010183 [Recurvomyces mirabilis]|uniref:Uncharacterized protein n=1 Tax=Recurvomyces mirabilis TaxID=574656 RepID=A0AAE0TMU1_9PEZI|nr:hypothetical protein LTR78_010183 [Recurvomyces mirabilis]KAK5149712.1 hypothetical protein LTS14_010710 [Recurvomyces mirabilis]